jgi:hypothetical protein
MKLKKVALAIVAAATAVLASGIPTPAEAKTYTLYCRGGGALDVSTTLLPVPDGKYKWKRVLAVEGSYYFKRGKAKYSPKLGPGKCTWSDRGMRSGEPTRIVLKKDIQGERQKMTFRIRRGRSSVKATKANGSPIPYRELSSLDHLLTSTKIIPFRVRKKGNAFVVQQVLEPIPVKGNKSGRG